MGDRGYQITTVLRPTSLIEQDPWYTGTQQESVSAVGQS